MSNYFSPLDSQCRSKWKWWQFVRSQSIIPGYCRRLCICCDSCLTNRSNRFPMQQSYWTFRTNFRPQMESIQWLRHCICFRWLFGELISPHFSIRNVNYSTLLKSDQNLAHTWRRFNIESWWMWSRTSGTQTKSSTNWMASNRQQCHVQRWFRSHGEPISSIPFNISFRFNFNVTSSHFRFESVRFSFGIFQHRKF